MSVTTDRTQTEGGESFDSLAPATGDIVATLPVHGEAEVREAVQRARKASQWWGALSFDERARRLRAFAGVLARRRDELLDLISRENGKPRVDALIEHTLVLEHLGWAAKNARRVMKPRKVSGSLLLSNTKPILEYQPLGVVGIIGPWNYPRFTPRGAIAYALAAGNAVVFKPSEYTPAVGAWLAAARGAARPAGAARFQGGPRSGETGAALCRAGVGKLAFTGSAPTGRKVMAACAETLTPVLLELGGKDAMIVDDDADVVAAADSAVWGAMSNGGQTCIGIERTYATSAVYDRFVAEVTEQVRTLRPGSDDEASYGPKAMASQTGIVRRHVDEAASAGGRMIRGDADPALFPDENYLAPTVLL